jgi:signal transduction histidine kinase
MNAKKEKLLEEWQKEKETLQKQLDEKSSQLREMTLELEIEAALERVRAQSMDMQKSEELVEVVRQLKKEIMELGIDIDVTQIVIDFTDDPHDGLNDWVSVEEQRYLQKFHIPFIDHPITTKFYETLENDLDTFTVKYSKPKKNAYFKLLFERSDFKDIPEERKKFILEAPGWVNCVVIKNNCSMQFARYRLEEFTREEVEIFKQFGKVFGQAYTRFLDLQKAEEQAREAQIEASLERVRAQSMGMQQSEELINVVQQIGHELKEMDIEVHNSQIWTDISDDPTANLNIWLHVDGQSYLEKFHFPLSDHPIDSELFEAIGKNLPIFSSTYSKSEIEPYLRYAFNETDLKRVSKERKDIILNAHGWTRCTVILKEACLHFGRFNLNEFTDREKEIFKRFGKVFEQAYTRFLDLQKAEEQAREAQIEASLERVRAKAMAMHNSKDIESATAVVFNELSRLGIDLERCGITLMNETPVAELWSTTLSHDNKEVIDIVTGYLDFRIHPLTQKSYRDWKEKKKFSTYYLVGEELKKYYDKLEKQPEYKFPKVDSYPDQQVLHSFFFNAGAIFVYTTTELSNESKNIVHRFTKVFEQTYTRFLDLKKAEAQAREAMIEAALERVRARSMAMQKSDELHDVLSVLFEQFYILGIEPVNVFLSLFDREERTLTYRATGTGGSRTQGQQVVSLDSLDVWKQLFEKWMNDNSDSVEVIFYEKEILPTLFSLLDETFSSMPPEERLRIEQFPEGGYTMHGYTPFGYIGYNHTRPATEEEKEILTKFASEFSRVYQRFLDIQKAEEQAREAEIQLALERVRAKSMAMQQSDDLTDVLTVIFDQLSNLGIQSEWTHLTLIDLEANTFTYRMTTKEGKRVFADQEVALDASDLWLESANTFKSENPETITRFHIPVDSLPDIWEIFDGIFSALEGDDQIYPEDFPDGIYTTEANCKFGYLGINRKTPDTKEDGEILARFAREFGSVYQRFLDIQKAEEQAREAKIEAALERVRARSMGMHKSDDLIDVVREIGKGIHELGIQLHYSQIYTDYTYDPKTGLNIWVDVEGQDYLEKFHLPYIDHTITLNHYNALNEGLDYFSERYSKAEKDFYFKLLFKYSDLKRIPKKRKELILNASGWTRFTVILNEASLNFGRYSLDEFTDEEHEIFIRFAKVFGQAYTRFLDLKKAEEQAREAQIEAALERVRSRSLAMQKTIELQDVVRLVAEELKNTGVILDTGGAVICTYFQDSKDVIHWTATDDPAHPSVPYLLPYFEDELFDEAWESKSRGDDYFAKVFSYDVKNAFFSHAFKHSDYRQLPDEYKKIILESKSHGLAWAWSENSAIMIPSIQGDLPSEEEKKILVRFAKVFEQSFIRFLDLQKAEEQAREAKIETALEKVRSRTMGMQSSEELPEVANIMFLEVQALGIPAWSCGYCILLDDGKSSTCIMSSEGTLQKPFLLPHYGEVSFEEWDDFVQSEKTFFTQELGGKAIESHYNFMKSLPQLTPIFRELEEAGLSLPTYQINHLCKISHGFLLFITYEQVPDAHDIFKRFTNVFEQTYTRFLDLKKAEKLALETARQSSLDRIRAEIGSMRSAEDLQQITPIIWDELKTLEIPFIRCGVFIIDEENELSHTYLSTSQGDPIAALHLPLEDIPLVKNAVSSWKQKKIYTEHWDEEDFRDWTQNLIDRGFIDSKKKYEAGSAPATLDLHFLPFKHGMLYIGNTEPLSQKSLDLGQSMAKAFSVAYDRYEDFNKLEQAKQKIEEAFKELEAAKDQLVQQEKLASLGQLTAGIAHEIKNPLNFVNNFSDLSIELVEEAREELSALSNQLSEGAEKSPLEGSAEAERRRGVSDEAANHGLILEILDDIENNLKTIHKHGTRADGIVKSMLQHSRGGSGKMEPTNVNALIKEYANLAFHGMRAGKDPINVDIKLDLDKNVGEVEMISEDFSRVILNLCNNAFDAMREKLTLTAVNSHQSADSPFEGGSRDDSSGDYEPKLFIRTHKKDASVTIEIQDNGPGIPDEIKDKILQPFFTTKKGTAGTGLGLSITNDIVKAHGGKLNVVTNNDEGTKFIILIPLNHSSTHTKRENKL